jgi:hypothetical protein
METVPNDAKKVFKELGTCSRTFFFLLNRAFGHNTENEERAADPLAGGILREGHQCGMLWGATMAVGAEAYRRAPSPEQAVGLAIQATQQVVHSFTDRTGTVDCRAITRTDFKKPLQMFRYMLFRARSCFNLAEEWAPEAVEAALKGLDTSTTDPAPAVSCATEVARQMGASDEEMVTMAGLAGGLGLSGQGCGALAAAIWMHTLAWSRENPDKSGYNIPEARETLERFKAATNGKMRCEEICGKCFSNAAEHSEYIRHRGCEALMATLAERSAS